MTNKPKASWVDNVIVKTALDILEERESAARTLKPIVERRTPRKHPNIGGKPKCKVCGAKIRGDVKNHNAGDFHRNALKAKGQT